MDPASYRNPGGHYRTSGVLGADVSIFLPHFGPFSTAGICCGDLYRPGWQENAKSVRVYLSRYTAVLSVSFLSILDFPDEELADSDNPFALVVLAAKTALLERKIPKQELLNRKVSIAGKLLRRGFQSRKVRAILKFLENCVRLEDEEMNRIFRERIQSQDKNFVMGIDEYVKMEGIEEGIEIRNRQFVENLLRETEFSTEKISALADVTVEFVNEVRNGLKDRATGE